MGEKILVVDHEISIVTLLGFHLRTAGYEVFAATDGRTAVKLAKEEPPDLMILSKCLPDMDSFDVFQGVRQTGARTMVIALIEEEANTYGVSKLKPDFADDSVTKPVNPKEMLEHVKIVLGRYQNNEEKKEKHPEEYLFTGDLEVYPERYEAYLRGSLLDFTPKEFELLVFLLRNEGCPLSRKQLMSEVWHYDFVGDTRIVDVQIGHLRKKIEKNRRKPQYIKTIRGIGYQFEEPT